MTQTTAVTSLSARHPDAFTGEQKDYWIEIQLVDEQGIPVAGMPCCVENEATRAGNISPYEVTSDAAGIIKIDKLHWLKLTLTIQGQPLADEMEKRSLRAGRDASEHSDVKRETEAQGKIWRYAVIGELCRTLPDIELRKGEIYATYHFPPGKTLRGVTIEACELCRQHVIEICPFRAWELVLHHQKEYSLANALNLGGAASLAYADDKALDEASITRFFLNQCQDLSKLPQVHKGSASYNLLVTDVPFKERYYPPVFMDTSNVTTGDNNKEMAADGDTQLFYVYNKMNIIVSWRGTASLFDLGTDLAFRPISTEVCEDEKSVCNTLFTTGLVHTGFWHGYCRVGKKFRTELAILDDRIQELSLFVCGHSLGGALALIYSAFFKENNPVLYTYGMPRTFTRDACLQLSELVHYRHINDKDPIPAVPPEANVDNYFYELWGPIGSTLGGLWSSLIQVPAWKIIGWGDRFWHQGHPVVFLTATQCREYKDCKVDVLPTPRGCIRIRNLLPIEAKLFLVPSLAEHTIRQAEHNQRDFKQSIIPEDLKRLFPQETNPERGAALVVGNHFMTAYMPYMNNQLLSVIDELGMSGSKTFTEHRDNVAAFVEQMQECKNEIPVSEYQRNNLFIELDALLKTSLQSTCKLKEGEVILKRFAIYGEEAIENA